MAPNWFEAYDEVLTPLLGPYGFVNVLLGADSSGALEALNEDVTLEELASVTGLPEGRAQALLDTLVVHDVVVRSQDRFRLAEPWQALMASDGFATLSDTLASARIEGRLLRDAASGADYWTMPTEDRLVFARAISPNPFAGELVEGFRRQLAADPDASTLANGGLLLELGCGVAGRVLTMLQALPAMRAVGVELSEDLAKEARRRAVQLGVSDRFEVVCADAATFSRPGAFDTAMWSQFFFPEAARPGALRTLLDSLRPGGIAQAPLLDPDATAPADIRYRALFRMILGGWGVPDRDRDGLAAEFADAGFEDIRYVGGGSAGPVRLVARKP